MLRRMFKVILDEDTLDDKVLYPSLLLDVSIFCSTSVGG